jgi:hypothetical protein
VTVNSKEENSKDFCPNYVQEFGLCSVGAFMAYVAAGFKNMSFIKICSESLRRGALICCVRRKGGAENAGEHFRSFAKEGSSHFAEQQSQGQCYVDAIATGYHILFTVFG